MKKPRLVVDNSKKTIDNPIKTNEQWEKILDPDVYYICRLKGTEAPGSGKYNDHFKDGIYNCACCQSPLFSSTAKYKSGCGWPSFFQALDDSFVEYRRDTSYDMVRVEVVCNTCKAHLGHVFDDGPDPTGRRYCINSLALDFDPEILS